MSDNADELQDLVDFCIREAVRLRQKAENVADEEDRICALELAEFWEYQAETFAKQLQPARRAF